METHDERKSREARHMKKQTKKTSRYKKGLAPSHKEKNLRNKILAEVLNEKN